MALKNTQDSLHGLQAILANRDLFASIDAHFANFMARLAKKNPHHVALAAALVSRKTGEGNICLDLAEYAEKPLDAASTEANMEQFACPPLSDWTDTLAESGLVGRGEENTPLVLDRHGRLYLRRYWEYENFILRFIKERSRTFSDAFNFSRLAEDLGEMFPPLPAGEIDWQKIAALVAVTRPFCVISGGPGTGKTATVAKILAILLGQAENPEKMRILLGAPTGKAASRLQEAIASTGLIPARPEPLEAATVHRMLGSLPNSPYFRHNAANPLAADVIVIDEASMVDLPLMAKLMGAVPSSARLILLGDRHQLASVQPGSVLGDICHSATMNSFSAAFCRLTSELTGVSLAPASQCETKKEAPVLQDSFVEFIHSYRFSPGSSIAQLASAVKEGQADTALDILLAEKTGEVAWSELVPPAELAEKLQAWPGFANYDLMQQDLNPVACFDVLDRFRILCALRSGPYGMEKINAILAGQIGGPYQKGAPQSHFAGSGIPVIFRAGQPVMVTENDYGLQLFNGDVGVVLPDPKRHDALRVFFRKDSGSIYDIAPAMLPAHETVFAMTVHKSQGSEFDSVLLILPDRDSPVLTRELLYTAITRARIKVEIWGKKEIFRSAVKRRIKRTSGLSEALWGTASS